MAGMKREETVRRFRLSKDGAGEFGFWAFRLRDEAPTAHAGVPYGGKALLSYDESAFTMAFETSAALAVSAGNGGQHARSQTALTSIYRR